MDGGAGRLGVLAADDAKPVVCCAGPCRNGATLGFGRRHAGPRVSTAPATSAGAASLGTRVAGSHAAGATDRIAASGSRSVAADTHGGGG